MTTVEDHDVNVVDDHPANPWGPSHIWHSRGAVAVETCSKYVEANPGAADDTLWDKAHAVAGEVFDVHLDTGHPISDAGLHAAIDAAMVPMLFAYMQALRGQLPYRRTSDRGSASGGVR
jgi:hypothetical protein